jgi:hypothetical protein
LPIQFAREPLTESLWDEAMPLLSAHWAEIAAFPDIPLEPDRELYAAGEANGILRVFTARHYDPEYLGPELKHLWHDLPRLRPLVGYALYFVRSNPHYRSSLQANQDVIYLAPSVRGKTGLKFLAWCDDQLAAEGVQVVYQHLKVKADHARLMAYLGYEAVDTIYAKRLDDPYVLTDKTWGEVRQFVEAD